LSAHLKEREERIQHVLERLREESVKGIPIVVEGKKDVQSLRQLGVEGEIICAKTGGKSRLDLISEVEERGAKEVILLFDFDRRGNEWTGKVRQQLDAARIKSDLNFRRELKRFTGKEVKDVEGLASYMLTLRRKLGEAYSP
jgi:5S rRNA maturation endonuclease (ribonuclease M5)